MKKILPRRAAVGRVTSFLENEQKNWPALFFIPPPWPFDRQGYRCSSPKIPLDCFPVRNEIMAIFQSDTKRATVDGRLRGCSWRVKTGKWVVKGLEKNCPFFFFYSIHLPWMHCFQMYELDEKGMRDIFILSMIGDENIDKVERVFFRI